MQDLLAATIAASVKALIGPAACYTGVCALAECVHQNCVLGRCANLCSILGLHLPSLMEKREIGYGQFNLRLRGGFVTQCWFIGARKIYISHNYIKN